MNTADFSSFFANMKYPLVDKTHLEWKENLSGKSTGGFFYKAIELISGFLIPLFDHGFCFASYLMNN